MLIHFTVNQTSNLTELDLLLSRLSEKQVSNLSLGKSEDGYRVDYNFSTEPLPYPDLPKLYDLMFEFRMAFLMEKLRDFHVHYDGESRVFIQNSSYFHGSFTSKESALTNAFLHLDKASLILKNMGISLEESPLFTQAPGTRKYKKNTLQEAIEVLKASLTTN